MIKLWESLCDYFSIVLSWLKSLVQKLKKNRKLCKRIILVLLFVLTWQVGVRYGAAHVEIPEPEVVRVQEEIDPDLDEMLSQYKAEKSEHEENVNAIAKVLYGYRYNSERDLEGIVWVILNRVDNQAEFKNFSTILSVINQQSQWMGYSEDNLVLEDLYEIADNTLYKYETGGKRLFGQEYLYFTWSSEYILFRTELYDSKTCRFWRAY